MRISSIDFTRGLVMVIMALDHVRDLLHVDSIVQSPTDLSTTTPLLFFTRWITYLCAPTFVFLAGTSAYLSYKKTGNAAESRKFLLKRGLWLLAVEFTLVNFALFFDPRFNTVIFEVIAAIGIGFIVLSLFIDLPRYATIITGIIIVSGHNFVSMLMPSGNTPVTAVVSALLNPSAFPLFPGHVLFIAYPPIPWLGIMLLGFGAGRLFELQAETRKKYFLVIGSAAIALFTILRFINGYGEPIAWSLQKSRVFSFLSFMNVSKYPPSLAYCLVTLGIMFLMLLAAEHIKTGILTKTVSTYGKVPLFYFVVHFYLIHALLILILFAQGFDWAQLEFATGTFGRPKNAVTGIPLWAVYVTWIAVVAALYKPCLRYSEYKLSHRHWWLRYL